MNDLTKLEKIKEVQIVSMVGDLTDTNFKAK